jgi:ATP-dependent DNA helicase RecG
MDVSKLDEMPPGRQPIDTRWSRWSGWTMWLARSTASEGRQQAYWVCPMVRELETEDIAAAEARYAR